jgi:hypothetical protein
MTFLLFGFDAGNQSANVVDATVSTAYNAGQNLMRDENSKKSSLTPFYGIGGSARPDVFNPRTGELFDYKFVRNPGQGLTARQRAHNTANVPGLIRQTEINP